MKMKELRPAILISLLAGIILPLAVRWQAAGLVASSNQLTPSSKMDPSLEVELWAFDHGTNQWVNYGMGVVNQDGVTATSSEGSGLPFTGWGAAVTRSEVGRKITSTASCCAARVCSRAVSGFSTQTAHIKRSSSSGMGNPVRSR
jgi:hypothetical protein